MKKFLLLVACFLLLACPSWSMDDTGSAKEEGGHLVPLRMPLVEEVDQHSLRAALGDSLPQLPTHVRHIVADCFDKTILITNAGRSMRVLTPRLFLDSLVPTDLPVLVSLFGNSVVMGKYAERAPRSSTKVADRFNGTLYPRWQNADPRGGFIIRLATTPIGFVILGAGSTPKRSEVALLLFPQHWQHGYAKEVAMAFIRVVPRLLRERLLDIDGVESTSSLDNPGSSRPLDVLGFTAANPGLAVIADDTDIPVGTRYNIQDAQGILRTAEKIRYTAQGAEGKTEERVIRKIHVVRRVSADE